MSNQAPNSDEVPPKSSEVEETANPQQEPGEEETAVDRKLRASGILGGRAFVKLSLIVVWFVIMCLVLMKGYRGTRNKASALKERMLGLDYA